MTAWTPPAFTGEPTTVQLSPMRANTLECLCRGLSNRQIAEQLLICEDTVKSHIKNVLRALGASDRTHAVVLVLTGRVRIRVGSKVKARSPSHGCADEGSMPSPSGENERSPEGASTPAGPLDPTSAQPEGGPR